MTQSIENAVAEIADVVANTYGIVLASGTPKENYSEYPFAMTYILNGQVGNEVTDSVIGLHNIAVDLLVPREWDIGDSLPVLHPILDSLKVSLWSEVATSTGGFFNNSIDTFSNMLIDFLPSYPYGTLELIGYRIILEGVKIVTNL